MALDSKVMFVTLPPTARPKALLRPVTWLVSCMLELANQDFTFGEVHA